MTDDKTTELSEFYNFMAMALRDHPENVAKATNPQKRDNLSYEPPEFVECYRKFRAHVDMILKPFMDEMEKLPAVGGEKFHFATMPTFPGEYCSVEVYRFSADSVGGQKLVRSTVRDVRGSEKIKTVSFSVEMVVRYGNPDNPHYNRQVADYEHEANRYYLNALIKDDPRALCVSFYSETDQLPLCAATYVPSGLVCHRARHHTEKFIGSKNWHDSLSWERFGTRELMDWYLSVAPARSPEILTALDNVVRKAQAPKPPSPAS